MNYTCPVCGYSRLPDPPSEYTICPSCGTEFGYDDFASTYDDLRQRWILQRMPWFSTHTQPPQDWNPATQLLNSGLAVRITTPEMTAGRIQNSQVVPFVAWATSVSHA